MQLLYNNAALHTQFYSSLNDLGPHVITQLSQVVYGETVPEVWGDFYTWPSGTHFGQNASSLKTIPYFDPSSPGNRCANLNPYNFRGFRKSAASARRARFRRSRPTRATRFWNNASIFKLQYQHNMGSNAYFRIYGYSVLLGLAADEPA